MPKNQTDETEVITSDDVGEVPAEVFEPTPEETTPAPKPRVFIAEENQTYEKQPDGTLRPVYIESEAATRQLKNITDKHIINGVRIENGEDPNLPAEMVKFEKEESEEIVALVKDILQRRAAKTTE